MKKITALLLILSLLTAAPALAAGQLIVQQENLQVYKPYAFLFVKVMNVGDEPMEITSVVELYDMDQEMFRASELIPMGDVLKPGEYTYAYFGVYLYGDTEVSGYTCELEGMEDSGFAQTVRYDSQAALSLSDADDAGDCILITFTNTTDEILFAPNASGILLDSEGNILYLTVPILYDIGITPGSTVIFKCDIPPYVLHDVNIEDLTVDSVVYTNEYE